MAKLWKKNTCLFQPGILKKKKKKNQNDKVRVFNKSTIVWVYTYRHAVDDNGRWYSRCVTGWYWSVSG